MARILIVDDDPLVRSMMNRILEAVDHRVDHAADGLEALAQIAVVRPDLVITDIEMPEMTGTQLIEILRRTPGADRLPILVVTGAAHAIPLGAEHVLKPFTIDTLLTKVNALLLGSESAA